jgi:NTP pyrophosphatase (non-canonical NTP hydrolase)
MRDVNEYGERALGFLNSAFAEEWGARAEFRARLNGIAQTDTRLHTVLLVKAAMALPSEAGEFAGLVDKVLFQGYALDDAMYCKMVHELGDVAWSWALGCQALGIDPAAVLQANVEKLDSRFASSGGTFSTAARQADTADASGATHA